MLECSQLKSTYVAQCLCYSQMGLRTDLLSKAPLVQFITAEFDITIIMCAVKNSDTLHVEGGKNYANKNIPGINKCES